MKRYFRFVPLRWVVLIAWGSFAVILTTQSDCLPLVHLMTSTIGSTEWGDAIGHAGLFGMLTFIGYLVASLHLGRALGLLLAIIMILILGGVTELAQFGVLHRAPSISDFLANALGIFVVGFAITYRSLYRLRYEW